MSTKRRGGAKIRCEKCGCKAELQKGRFGYYYRCPICGASVGCFSHTKEPLGTLADNETKALRVRCHELFDPIWRSSKRKDKQAVRNETYVVLAEVLGIPVQDCHFGKMEKKDLLRAEAFLKEFRRFTDGEKEGSGAGADKASRKDVEHPGGRQGALPVQDRGQCEDGDVLP